MLNESNRGDRFKQSRSTEANRFILQKYTGAFLPEDNLFMMLPTKTWQKGINHSKEYTSIYFKCDACGFHHTIGPEYTVDKTGLVSPSFGRMGAKSMCTFTEWLKLDDWDDN